MKSGGKLIKSTIVQSWMMNNPRTKEFQNIKLLQTGKRWSNQYYLAVDSFKLFGILI